MIVFGATAIADIAVTLFNPSYALLAISIDDEYLPVQHGLRRPKTVEWDDVVDLEISGPERSELGAELTVDYQTGRRRSLSELHLSKVATGLSPEELDPILRARWQPGTRTERYSNVAGIAVTIAEELTKQGEASRTTATPR